MQILFKFVYFLLLQTDIDPKLNSENIIVTHNARYNYIYIYIFFFLQNLIQGISIFLIQFLDFCFCFSIVEEAASIQEEGKGKSCCEAETTASEDERQRVRVRSLKKKKKKTMSGASSTTRLSLSLSHTLKKRGNRVADCRFASISINDVRDAKEEEAVNAFRETLLEKKLLPARHDDYHTLLR